MLPKKISQRGLRRVLISLKKENRANTRSALDITRRGLIALYPRMMGFDGSTSPEGVEVLLVSLG